ncbi:MAG: dihydrofolate reductase family protein [Candidatus Dormibacteraceae bacterium]
MGSQKLRVHNFAISLDGYAAGPGQDIDNPLGRGGMGLHEWVFATRTWNRMRGQELPGDGGTDGLDDGFLIEGDAGIGATVMGRNMFGPIRGLWNDTDWSGWWGDDPPYHHPVFVLTHHAREPIVMQGGTTFHFVTDGIEAALERAFDAANGADVRLGGGASTIQQYMKARLIDEMHVAIVPVLLGSGERLFDHLDGGPVGYRCVELVSSPAVVHIRLVRQ